MKRSDAFPSNYVGKEDIANAGGSIRAIIENVAHAMIQGDGGQEKKAVMYFRGDTVKPLILNNINWTACEEVYGDDTDYWHGKPVELYIDPNVMFGTKRVGGVRIRIPSAAPTNNGPSQADVLKAAKAAAWKAVCAKHPNVDDKSRVEALEAYIEEFFPGKTKDQLGAEQWQKMVAADFKPQLNPIPDDGGIPSEDIPF